MFAIITSTQFYRLYPQSKEGQYEQKKPGTQGKE